MLKLLLSTLSCVLLLIVSSLNIRAQQQPWNNIHYEWHKPGTAGTVKFVRNDSFGNSWFIGTFTGTVNFNPEGLDIRTSNGGTDVFLTKRDPDGNYLFTRTFGGAVDVDVHQVEMYEQFNRPVLYGTFGDGIVDFNPHPSITALRGGSGERGYLLGLNDNGSFNWVRLIGGNISDLELGSLAVDGSTGECALSFGSLMSIGEEIAYIDGVSQAASDLNYIASGLGRRHFLVKTNANGQGQWMGDARLLADLSAHALYMSGGTLFHAATYNSTPAGIVGNVDYFGGNAIGDLNHPGGGINEMYVAKYDYSGTLLDINKGLRMNYAGGGTFEVLGNNLYFTAVIAGHALYNASYSNTAGSIVNVPGFGMVLYRFNKTDLSLINDRVLVGADGGVGGSLSIPGFLSASLSRNHTQIHFRNELGTDYMFFGAYNSSGFNVFKMELDFSNEVVLATLGQKGNYWFDGNYLWHGTSTAYSLPTNYDPNGSQIESTGLAHAKYSICQLGSGSNYDDFVFCEGSAATIPALDLGENWYWTDGTNDFFTTDGELVFDPIGSEHVGGYTAYAQQSECVWIPSIFDVQVQTMPEFIDVSADISELCEGEDVTLEGSYTPGITVGSTTLEWSGPDGYSHSGAVSSFTTNSNSEGWYYFQVDEKAGTTCTIIDSVYITVNDLPEFIQNVAVNAANMCEGGTIELSADGGVGVDYLWSGPNGFTSTEQNPIIPNANQTNSGNYVLVITDQTTGCSNETGLNDNVDVLVSPLPVITSPVSASNDNLCVGEDIELQSEFVLGVDYLWSGPNGFTSTEQNPIIPNANQTNSGNYVLVITDQTTGCSNETGLNDNVGVLVNDPAQISSVESSDGGSGVCFGESVQVSGNISGGTLNWSGPNGFEFEGNTITINGFSSVNSGWYFVELTDTVNGCPNSGGAMSDSIYLNGINCDIIIPEIFSPNADGYNDGFVIVGLENYPGTNLRIFNRWGSEIFFRDDYQNDWFGQSESKLNIGKGDILPEGVYFYLIELGGNSDEIFKGNVYLKR